MDEDQALARLHAILAQPAYRVDTSRSWWDQLTQPVWDLLNALLARLVQAALEAGSGQAGIYGWIVLVACAVLIAAAAVYLARAIRLTIRGETLLASTSLADRRQQSERLWQTAQRLAADGQLAEAVRAIYLSALYALDERALLRVESSQTNREHARELRRAHPDLSLTFSEVVDRYDRLRYGRGTVTPQAFDELSQLVARARSEALRGGVA
jgi:hypothetical protein